MTSDPRRPVTEQHVQEFESGGITCLRAVFDSAEVERFRRAVESSIAGDHKTVLDYGSGRKFVNGFHLWTWNAELKSLICESHLPRLAARLMGSRKVNLLYDQLFIKEPGTPSYRTPWHNDQPYWTVKGWQVISFWIALDPVTKESGAVEFVRGSHRWNRWFQPRSFAGDNKYAPDPDFEEMPDIDARRADYDIVHYDLEPGDVTVHHGMTVHGAAGNSSGTTRRRGYSVRYTGDDAVYEPRASFPLIRDPGLAPGAPLDSDVFPVVFRE